MKSPVDSLLAYHATTHFGSAANRRIRSEEAHQHYVALDRKARHDLALRAMSEIGRGRDRMDRPLECLACFHPGCLASCLEELSSMLVLPDGPVYFGAPESVARRLIGVCMAPEYASDTLTLNGALSALAWIGSSLVQSTFAEWRDRPPVWTESLHVPPHEYARVAGWELTADGARRDLCSIAAYPLMQVPVGVGHDHTLTVWKAAAEECEWCRRRLVAVIDLPAMEDILSGHGRGRLRIVTCDLCACFGSLSFSVDRAGDPRLHPTCERPRHLPEGVDAIPLDHELAVSPTARHAMGACLVDLPGVRLSQIGGMPAWVQGTEYPACPDCGATMPFVCQIDNEDIYDSLEGMYYAFRCRDCSLATVTYQQT